MRIGTAEAESTFMWQGEALRRVLEDAGVGRPIEIVEARQASIENALNLGDGAIEFGFMAANWIGRAREGRAPFTAPIDLRMVAPMNMGPMFFIARPEARLRGLRDLRGRRVAVGPERSGARQHAESILGPLGLTFDDFTPVYLDFAAGAEALKRGEIDAQLQCPYPNKAMSALDATFDFDVIGLSEQELAAVIARSPTYRRAIMRKGSLRALKSDLAQPGVLNVLVTHERVGTALVREVTRAIVEQCGELGRLNPLFAGLCALFEPLREQGAGALRLEGVALHPGALAAYRDCGLIT